MLGSSSLNPSPNPPQQQQTPSHPLTRRMTELSLRSMINSFTTLLDPAVYTNNPRVIHTVYTVALPRLTALIEKAYPTLDAYT